MRRAVCIASAVVVLLVGLPRTATGETVPIGPPYIPNFTSESCTMARPEYCTTSVTVDQSTGSMQLLAMAHGQPKPCPWTACPNDPYSRVQSQASFEVVHTVERSVPFVTYTMVMDVPEGAFTFAPEAGSGTGYAELLATFDHFGEGIDCFASTDREFIPQLTGVTVAEQVIAETKMTCRQRGPDGRFHAIDVPANIGVTVRVGAIASVIVARYGGLVPKQLRVGAAMAGFGVSRTTVTATLP